jgi:hypothetical protein
VGSGSRVDLGADHADLDCAAVLESQTRTDVPVDRGGRGAVDGPNRRGHAHGDVVKDREWVAVRVDGADVNGGHGAHLPFVLVDVCR